ncbi:branched-chain amino acid ABC transporter permease [Streptosporangium lutulentum]|uniref:Branched-chain amino acid transport system permease protein n=1 Tax=Streptosporangium lutulentum TaxID=1461250 RepID=A0ABT9QJT1_9ACTN|nr:branched-chain amino acid ABC transporter permease [Streptosporangium lutulentum]MDP9847017.1 branched-chain amino acid transport system permease protein [Streptosporangium lutulentum]
MTTFLQLIVSGIISGAGFGLFALALSLVYRVTNVINLAFGEIAMVGVLGAVFLHDHGLPWAVAGIVMIAVGGVLGLVFDLLVTRSGRAGKLGGSDFTQKFLLTLALSITLQGVGLRIFGRDVHTLAPILEDKAWRLGSVAIDPNGVLVVLFGLAVVAALWVAFRTTLVGKAMLACGISERGSLAVGINLRSFRTAAFVIACAIAATTGVLMGSSVPFSYTSGFSIAIIGLVAASLVSLGNPILGFFGGIGVGLLQSIVGGYMSGDYQSSITIAVMIAVILVKPRATQWAT